MAKPRTSKPDCNIRKSSFVISGASVWQEKIKKWKQIYFLWIHIIFINRYIRKLNLKIWPTRFGLGGHPKDLLFRLWTLQPMCIELMMWTVKVGTCCDFFGTKVRVCCDFCDRNCVFWIFALNFSGFQLFGANIIYKNMSTKKQHTKAFSALDRSENQNLCKKP